MTFSPPPSQMIFESARDITGSNDRQTELEACSDLDVFTAKENMHDIRMYSRVFQVSYLI